LGSARCGLPINGGHVRPEHVEAALDAAAAGPVAEGSVGGGTGTNCNEFKGGNGTASRRVSYGRRTFTVAAVVQAVEEAVLNARWWSTTTWSAATGTAHRGFPTIG
jgi:L-aminopeptidase/D-esterase-like protein